MIDPVYVSRDFFVEAFFLVWVARGYIHVYFHYFQTHSSLKRLDQSRLNLHVCEASLGRQDKLL